MKELIHPKQLKETDQITINQLAHGFVVGDYLNYDKTTSTWVKANTTGNYTDGAIGRVIDVESVDAFELKTFGIIIDYAGVAGDYYYPKNDGSGNLTNVSPASIIQEVLFGLPGNKAVELKTLSKIKPQNSVYVSTNGNDSGNGTILNPYKTIQKAIDSSQVNGTVIIDSGTYTEDLTIVDGVNLIAVSKHTVTVIGKLTINNTTTNNGNAFEGINFVNSIDHTVNHHSSTYHNLSFYECNITQNGVGAFNALNITATNGDSQYKNTQISCQFSTGGSRAVYSAVGSNFGMTCFDCLIGVEDNSDNPCIDLNGSGGFIFVGKNINGQTLANGDNIVLLAYGGISTNSVPVLITTMPTAPAIILNANIISSANPCVTGTGLFLFGNVFFFNGVYLDFAVTLSSGAGAQAVKIDSAMGLRYRNVLSGLTATNIQDAIDEVANNRTLAVNQTTHGFAVNDNIIYDKNSSSWKKANIIGNYAVGTIAKVKTVVDANNFVLIAQGKIIPYTGLTAGEFYYAKDDGTGGLTVTPPTNVIQAVLFALPGNNAVELSYPAVTPSSVPTGIMPIGSEVFFEDSNPDTPAPSSEFVQANGQVISDALSPYNGKRIRNLNGATITGISITAVDDGLKTITISLNDVFAVMMGDSLTLDVSVPNAVIKSVNYATGIIEIGDFTSWSSGSFGLTTSSLIGATTFDVVGLKRFTRGNSSNTGGGGINTLQGHVHGNNAERFSTAYFPYIRIDTSGFTGGVESGINTTNPVNDGVNGTPRTSSDTTPNFADGVWLKKIK